MKSYSNISASISTINLPSVNDTKNFSDCESDITRNLVAVLKSMANSQTLGKLTCDYLIGHIPKVSYDKCTKEERQKEKIY